MTLPNVTLLKSTIGKTGGLEKYTVRLARAFAQKGAPTTLLTTGEVPVHLTHEAFHIKSCNLDIPLSFMRVQKFDEFCRHHLQKDPSKIVFGLDRNRNQTHIRAGNGVHAAYLTQRKKTEVFFKAASFAWNPLHKLLLSIEKKSFESPELQVLFTNSHMVKAEVLQHYNTDPKKIEVVHNGVEWKELEAPFADWEQKRHSILKKLELETDVFHLLFVGHNFARKGLDPVLEALGTMPAGDFHLSVVGKDKNIAFYKKKVAKLKLQDKVTFFGPAKDILFFYQMADALLIPSFYDPFANVTVEALAMGVLVISSKTNGGSEILTKDNGIIIPDMNDIDSIKQSLLKAMTAPKTKKSSEKIRNSIQHLDFSCQLDRIIQRCF